MGNRYQSEINEFHKNFDHFRGQRIVLYGIGRYTATLLEGVKDHCFVGLMDKEPANTGKVIFGLPVITKEEAERKADLVIINTSGTYWNVIYQRIQDMRIPVYFLNGCLAKEEEVSETETETGDWQSSLQELYQRIEDAQVVSFDFYDTLFSRKVSSPRDVFSALEWYLHEECKIAVPYKEMRSQAVSKLPAVYTLDELYAEIERISHTEKEIWARMKRKELEIEYGLLMQRPQICDSVRYALGRGKEVYIISDMYLGKAFYRKALEKYGIDLDEEKILVSGEMKRSKAEGTLWKYYRSDIVKNRKALHVGDDRRADVETPREYGIETFYTASPLQLLRLSAVREIESRILDEGTSCLLGLLLGELYQDPFRLYAQKGKIILETPEEMGYVVFGPVIFSFLSWLRGEVLADGIKKLVFMSRDGYFLEEDYQYDCGFDGVQDASCYLGISRQLVMTASIQTEEELWHFINMPYSGSAAELLTDRFDIRTTKEEETLAISELYERYREQIWRHVRYTRKNYLQYLESMDLHNDCAVVDLGFYGNNQRYLNLMTGLRMKGYYFNADLSKDNENARKNQMKACFQDTADEKSAKSKVLEKMIFLESFLTAPYGMLKAVDEEGNWKHAPGRGNQESFLVKEKINGGVKRFIRDCQAILQTIGHSAVYGEEARQTRKELCRFADCWYGLCMSGRIGFSEEIKKSFYNDNAMMNRFESMLFY